MEFSKAVNLRQSVRGFKPEQITKEQLNAILDAAYQAPTGMGKFENMKLIVVQSEEAIKTLRTEFEKTAPQGRGDASYGAPTLIYVCANAADEVLLSSANTGVMMENMLLAAADQGLGSCYLMGAVMMNRGNKVIEETIKLPEGFVPMAAVAVGTPAEPISERPVNREKYDTIWV